MLNLWDADLYNVRATACEVLAKHLYALTLPPGSLVYISEAEMNDRKHRKRPRPRLPPPSNPPEAIFRLPQQC